MENEMFQADKLAISRIPSSGVRTMNINDYIAALTHERDCAFSKKLGVSESLGRGIGMFVYLRDNFNAKTYEEAHQVLRDGKVNPSIIELWAEEGMLEYDATEAAAIGYPEYSERIRRLYSDRISKHL